MSLWGNIKGKVKKLGSSSRSRSSRTSSGSRDDMSVDSVRRPSRSQEEEEEAPVSLAVLRPRLKIRVLTSVDQIVFGLIMSGMPSSYWRSSRTAMPSGSIQNSSWWWDSARTWTARSPPRDGHALPTSPNQVRTFSPWNSYLHFMLKPLEKKLKSTFACSTSSLKCAQRL